jgi:hypothetical protein
MKTLYICGRMFVFRWHASRVLASASRDRELGL